MPKKKRLNSFGLSKEDRFVRLPFFLLRTAAWRSLSGNAAKLYVAVVERYNGQNNGEIGFSVREAEDAGLSKSNAALAFKELVDRGFLVIARSSLMSLKTKESRLWTITAELPKSAPEWRAFTRWRPPAETAEVSYGRDSESGRKKQNTVPPAGQSVPRAGQQPPKRNKVTRLRPTGGTQNAETADSASYGRDTSNIPYRVRAEADAATDHEQHAKHHSEQPAEPPPAQLYSPQSSAEFESSASAKTAALQTYKQRIAKLRVEIAHKLPRGDIPARRRLAVSVGMPPDQFLDYMGCQLGVLPDGVEEKLRAWLHRQV